MVKHALKILRCSHRKFFYYMFDHFLASYVKVLRGISEVQTGSPSIFQVKCFAAIVNSFNYCCKVLHSEATRFTRGVDSFTRGVMKRCSQIFCKIHRKIPVLSFLIKLPDTCNFVKKRDSGTGVFLQIL